MRESKGLKEMKLYGIEVEVVSYQYMKGGKRIIIL